jgi:hypothetical protein
MPITDVDLLTIQAAIDEGGEIWDNQLLSEIKDRIKTHYLSLNKWVFRQKWPLVPHSK